MNFFQIVFPVNLKAFAKKRAFPAWSCQSTPSVMEFNLSNDPNPRLT